jgi:putative component of toxin-antitoxin plasmid stabilization module
MATFDGVASAREMGKRAMILSSGNIGSDDNKKVGDSYNCMKNTSGTSTFRVYMYSRRPFIVILTSRQRAF